MIYSMIVCQQPSSPHAKQNNQQNQAFCLVNSVYQSVFLHKALVCDSCLVAFIKLTSFQQHTLSDFWHIWETFTVQFNYMLQHNKDWASWMWLCTCVSPCVLLKVSRGFEGLAAVQLMTSIWLFPRMCARMTLQSIPWNQPFIASYFYTITL